MFCGYDPSMSVGLSIFGEGIIQSTLLKAKSAGRPISEHIDVELKQLRALLDNLERIDPATADFIYQRRMLFGLAYLVEAIFASAKIGGIANEEEFRQHFTERFALAGNLIKKLENICEGLEREGATIDEMAQIGTRYVVEDS